MIHEGHKGPRRKRKKLNRRGVESTEDDMTETLCSAIGCGDILRTQWPERINDLLNLYLGSGRAGACFDAWGLMHNGSHGRPKEGESQGRSVLMHADHWHRGLHGLDYWLPVARLKCRVPSLSRVAAFR